MLSRVLLHMIAAAFRINAAGYANANRRQLGGRFQVVQYLTVLCIRNFSNSQTFGTFEREPSGIMYLTATGRIERRFAQDDGWSRLLRRTRHYSFHHRIEFVDFRIV